METTKPFCKSFCIRTFAKLCKYKCKYGIVEKNDYKCEYIFPPMCHRACWVLIIPYRADSACGMRQGEIEAEIYIVLKTNTLKKSINVREHVHVLQHSYIDCCFRKWIIPVL